LATGFSAEPLINGLVSPTAMHFAPDGRIFVAEKRGTIKMYNTLGSAAISVADLSTEVMDYWDRGLLDIAVNPQFPAKPYIYALYTMDGRFGDSIAAGTIPRYHDSCGSVCPVANRLDRIVIDPNTGAMVSKTTLIENWGDQYPSHAIGSMQWGPDGYLYVSGGEGASFSAVDYGDSNLLGDPPNAGAALTPPTAMGGALRSQVITPPVATPAFPTWFNGKVIRINPETMTPMLDPRTVPSPSPVVASGLRNPFRITFRGATKELWIGDVGWNDWEEINRIPDVTAATTAPVNFGWPCYEGDSKQGGYDSAGLSICQNLYNTPTSTVKPHYTYSHGTTVAPGDGCGSGGASITGLAFYDGASFPSAYQGGLFFADFSRQCTWFLPQGTDGLPSRTPQVFAQGAGAPVQLTVGPDGDLYYVDITGVIGRYHYTASNHAPAATVTASPRSGAPPLSVMFDASGSTDTDVGDTLSYAWDLDGDGAFDDGIDPIVSYLYSTPQNVTVKVRVSDQKGASSVASTQITVGNGPVPAIQVVSGANWAVGDTISVIGSATDAEDGVLAATAFDWSIILQHCPQNQACHQHVLEDLSDLKQVSLLGPDHDYPAHIDVVLTATDSDGISVSTTVSLQPATTAVTVTTVPPGLTVAVNQAAGTAPQSMTVIRGATTTVSAPIQTLNGTIYQLSSWSDGGAATHTLHPNAATLGLVATFAASGAPEQNLTPGGTPIALITAPTGGGNRDLGVIKDGIKPAVGSVNNWDQYDTFNGDAARANDWVGYTFGSTKQFTHLVFQEGENFPDGGAFDTLTVQTRSGGVWSNVSNLVIAPAYPSLNAIHYETFNLTFNPQSGDAIRIYGTPAGAAHFISVAELEVYGFDQLAVPGNYPPTANAGADQTVNLGAVVTLAGSGSDPEGQMLAYKWSQVGGPAVTLSSTTTPAPSFTAPATAAALTFQLITNDGAQDSVADTVMVTTNDPTNVNLTAAGTPVAFITAPIGGGSRDLGIIKDGVKPPVGSTDYSLQYDTYNGGGARTNDWVGYTFTSAKLFNKLVFQEGGNFGDGGAFTSLGVEVRNNGVWTNVAGVAVTPTYPGLNGVSYETFQLLFPAVSGDGIRISGTPAGSAHFVSIAELEVYGSNQAGPPPNLSPTANAGPDQNVLTNANVTLNGSGTDPEGAPITYLWSQIAGTTVALSSTTGASVTFTAPATTGSLTFQLLTNDGTQSGTADTVVINVGTPANLKPTANAGPDQNVLTSATVTLSGSGSDPEGASITYLWSQISGPAVTLSNTTTASPTFAAPAVAATLTFQLVTNDGTQNSTADAVVVGVTAPVNLKPTANAGPDQNANINATVTLNGSGTDPEGGAITYSWSQIGGPVVTLSSTSAASPVFTAPAAVTTLTFQLVTNDGTQPSTPDSVIISIVDPTSVNLTSAGTPVAFITAPSGGGNKSLAIIKDGVKPAVGSSDSYQQYDTYAGGGARASDWVGYTFTSAKQFSRVVFQEGINFADGGAFNVGSLTVQVRNAGTWSNVGNLVITPTYPGANATNYETFTMTFTAVTGDGIRIFGTPSGTAHFMSIAELEVYGSNTAGPPPNLAPTANAGADKSVNVNAAVTLIGTGADPEGAAISYQWSQIGGAVVALSGANTSTLAFTAPATPTTLTFQLVTNDGVQSGAADTVDVVVTDPSAINLAASGTPVAFITAPTGGGNKNLAIIKDGIKPAIGSSDSYQQYDTYKGGTARASDWVGYTFTSAKAFTRLVFQEGINFVDGGAFNTGTLTVQVRSGGVWTTVTGLTIAPAYPGPNATNYETFTLSFNTATGDGIRIFGTPSGTAHFMSIAELEVYGN